MKKIYSTIFLFLFFRSIILAQPAAGTTYDWETFTAPTIEASSTTGADATWIIGDGFTAVSVGSSSTGNPIRILISTSLGSNVLRYDRGTAAASVTEAILKSTSGGTFGLSALELWPTSGTISGTVTITAKKGGTTLGTVSAPYTAAAPINKVTVNVASNANFAAIDELDFTIPSNIGLILDSIVTRPIVLAVNLVSFDAAEVSEGIILHWSTAVEQNNNHFTIEHSNDGKVFTPLATIAGKNNTNSLTDYSYTDIDPFAKNNFYRLAIVSNDGSIKYSDIVAVPTTRVSRINFYPNPVVNHTVTILATAIDKGVYELMLFNNAGQIVYHTSINYTGGSTIQPINLPLNIGTGVYQVQLRNSTTIINNSLFVK